HQDRRGVLWVGTDFVLNRWEPRQGRFVRFFSTEKVGARFPGYIFDIAEDPQNNLWVGTYGNGLYQFHNPSGEIRHFTHDPDEPASLSSNRVRVLLPDDRGFLWVGTAHGLNRFDPETGQFSHYFSEPGDPHTLSHNDINTLYQDRGGVVWVGTSNGGLCRFDAASETFRTYRHNPGDPHSLSSNAVTAICEDLQGQLWVGTSNGLNKLDRKTGQWEQFYESDGLPTSYIMAMSGDEQGNLWISTTKGLCRFGPEERSYRNYAVEDGLQGLIFEMGSVFRAENGELFFGGNNGFNRFFPEKVRDNAYIPPIVITSFKKLGKAMPLAGSNSVELSYKENHFSLEFAALDFSHPRRNAYAYMLEGLDEKWVELGTRRSVNFSNLAPGHYVFRVKGSNSDGVWNEEGTSMHITVTPPYWETLWFRVLLLTAVAGVLVLAYRYRVARLLEVERTRNRIAQDLHDEVGTALSSISYFAQAIRSDAEARKRPFSLKFLSLISEISAEAQEAMSDIVWAIDPNNDEWDRILAKFRRYASDLFDSKGIAYVLQIPEALPLHKLDVNQRRNFWLIFKEMITNIVRHADCNRARVTITSEGQTLSLVVEDDGRGFDSSCRSEGNGVRNIYARAKMLGGRATLTSEGGRGTRWELRFGV
ncbi:MAG: hypothetical protein D6743_06620, partial [Calditrichaeota bacterium]